MPAAGTTTVRMDAELEFMYLSKFFHLIGFIESNLN